MKKSGDHSAKIRNSNQENNSKKVQAAEKYRVIFGSSVKKINRAREGEEKKSKKIKVKLPKEVRSSLNDSFGLIEGIEEEEQKV